MKYRLLFIGLAIFLAVSFVAATDVAYIYGNDARIDHNVLGIFSSMNLSISFISQSSLPVNLSGYKFIFVGDEYFTKSIPVSNYRTVIMNSHFGNGYGLTNGNGISSLSSRTPLEVTFKGKELRAYTSTKDIQGSYLSYYLLATNSKNSNLSTYAKTYSTGSGREGDVVSFVPKGVGLSNGKISKGEICFFGITKSDYWTEDSRNLFRDCVNFVNVVVPETNVTNKTNETKRVVCLKDSDCETNIFSNNLFCLNNNVIKNYTSYSCVNPGTQESFCLNKTQVELVQSCLFDCYEASCQRIRCKVDVDCDDNDTSTEDKCLNSGGPNSACSYKTNTVYIKLVSVIVFPGINNVLLEISEATGNNLPLSGYYLRGDKVDNVFVSGAKVSYNFENLSSSTDYNFFIKPVDNFNITSEELSVVVKTLPSNENKSVVVENTTEIKINDSQSEVIIENLTNSSDNSSSIVDNSTNEFQINDSVENLTNQTVEEVNDSQGSSNEVSGGSGGSGSSSGGSSGGSSSSSIESSDYVDGGGSCYTQWNCTEWSNCKYKRQVRVCSYPVNHCTPQKPKPIEIKSCVEVVIQNITVVESNNTSTNISSGSKITGAAIGAFAKSSWAILLVIVGLLIALYLTSKARKKKRR